MRSPPGCASGHCLPLLAASSAPQCIFEYVCVASSWPPQYTFDCKFVLDSGLFLLFSAFVIILCDSQVVAVDNFIIVFVPQNLTDLICF